ncbi:MAG TPA: IS1595 family transposase [Chloroflexota bacterium]|nr:IS1595 family transposase [Chloroflexota bacterium]
MKLTLDQVTKIAASERAAYDFTESVLWPHGPVCPHCGTVNHAYLLPNQKTRTGRLSERKLWKCGETKCRKQFTVTVGTVMEGSKIPLSKWVLAFNLFCAGKNGISSTELERQLGITHEAAWFMAHRIRYALVQQHSEPLTGIVEADETWVGGVLKGKGRGKGVFAQNKTPVVTLVERGGEVRSRTVPTIDGSNLGDALRDNVAQSAVLMTDTNPGYRKPGRMFRGHESVDHNNDEYVRGKGPRAPHVNTAEGYFSQLKRSIDGTHHSVSKQHLQRYATEFDHCYNTRKQSDTERMVGAISRTRGKRLKYESGVKGR